MLVAYLNSKRTFGGAREGLDAMPWDSAGREELAVGEAFGDDGRLLFRGLFGPGPRDLRRPMAR